jgi:hypothetical protein
MCRDVWGEGRQDQEGGSQQKVKVHHFLLGDEIDFSWWLHELSSV